jgi:hypothetical protein
MRSTALNKLYSAAQKMLANGSGKQCTGQVVEELRRLAGRDDVWCGVVITAAGCFPSYMDDLLTAP